jgi:tetratricopeptide (TPR) repeat protein
MPPLTATDNRLQRLEAYLQQDPGNDALLAEIFDVALASGNHERAEIALRSVLGGLESAVLDASGQWQARQLRLLLATHRWKDADALLDALTIRHGSLPAFIHDRAWIAFNRSDYGGCIELLKQLDLEAPAATVRDAPVQTLYVRALHRSGRLEEAVEWAARLGAVSALSAEAAAAASLAAIDAAAFDAARRLSELALAHNGDLVEGLVSAATLSLASRLPEKAIPMLERATTLAGQDGRTWSALGFARLQSEDLPGALDAFDRATRYMPGHVGTWIGRGWARLLCGQAAVAQGDFEAAIELDRNFAESHGSLAIAMIALEQRDAAADHIERAIRLDRACLSARYARHLLSGGASDPSTIRRFARGLLIEVRTPLGDANAADWIDVQDTDQPR